MELDKRKISDCPCRTVTREGRHIKGRLNRLACCSHPEHGGLCGYDGKSFLWRCKFGTHISQEMGGR